MAQFNPLTQIDLFNNHIEYPSTPNLDSYEKILVMMSGGKDSLASLLHLFDEGVDRSKIELWHHDVDGREGSELMDWPITRSYCQAVADAFDLPLYFSWKVGGFEGEMLKENARTAPTRFETPDGLLESGGKTGKLGTRLRFPQVTHDLTTRWCSSYLKIEVCSAALRNQTRFCNSRTLVITGERAEESPGRAKYKTIEPHKADKRSSNGLRRYIDHWRPVHGWSEAQVWEIIERYRVNPHPAYHLGWGRVSCMACIFGSKHQWATIRHITPVRFDMIAGYEKQFNCTIQRKESVIELADAGTVYDTLTDEMVKLALSREYTAPIIVDNWKLPAGAFGESCGPT